MVLFQRVVLHCWQLYCIDSQHCFLHLCLHQHYADGDMGSHCFRANKEAFGAGYTKTGHKCHCFPFPFNYYFLVVHLISVSLLEHDNDISACKLWPSVSHVRSVAAGRASFPVQQSCLSTIQPLLFSGVAPQHTLPVWLFGNPRMCFFFPETIWTQSWMPLRIFTVCKQLPFGETEAGNAQKDFSSAACLWNSDVLKSWKG